MMADLDQRSKTATLSKAEAQALEDERLALMMQNEEFLSVLKHDSDFMKTLETGNFLAHR